jgi:hypothetical protein
VEILEDIDFWNGAAAARSSQIWTRIVVRKGEGAIVPDLQSYVQWNAYKKNDALQRLRMTIDLWSLGPWDSAATCHFLITGC